MTWNWRMQSDRIQVVHSLPLFCRIGYMASQLDADYSLHLMDWMRLRFVGLN